jgi:hypothetical protein
MVVTKLRWPSPSKREGWSNQQIAEFYRISRFMERAGLAVEIEKGVTDEGDPWTVFIRQDTGDVIAHFARINDRFISVSSVTDTIFEGPDVRNVVDQMLNRHPLMIPSSSSKGKLFLHPGVVLSAFVAAAYFMAADTARADKIEKILGQVLHASDKDLNRDDLVSGRILDSGGAVSRKVMARTPTFEDSGSFSQMAVLGAVLRLKEIFAEEDTVLLVGGLETEEIVFYDDHSLGKKSDFDYLPSAITGKVFSTDTGAFEVNSIIPSGDANFFEELTETRLIPKEDGGNWISSSNQELEITSSLGELISVRDTSIFDNKNGAVNRGLQQIINLQNEVVADEGKSSSQTFDVQALANEVRETFDIVLQDILLGSADKTEGLGVAVIEGGKVAVVAINPNVGEQESLYTNMIVVEKEFERLASLEIPADQIENNVLNVDNGQAPANETPLVTENRNFLVHQVRTEGEVELDLTDATDIIFYWGGDLRVTNFELGKDLVWFFFSSDKLNQNYSESVTKNDLQLSFGMDDKLTFIDLVGTTGPIDAV